MLANVTNTQLIEEFAKIYLNRTWTVDQKIFNLSKLNWILKLTSTKVILGSCNFKLKRICVSTYHLNSDCDCLEEWTDTIKHEITHAIDYEIRGISDHGFRWKHIAKQIGCDPTAYCKAPLKPENPKYTITCAKCKTKTHKHRIYKTLIACKPCCIKHNHGKFSKDYLLTITQNY